MRSSLRYIQLTLSKALERSIFKIAPFSFFLFASRIALLKPSATSKKSRRERGQPCLDPHSAWKKGDAAPLMRTAKEVVVIHAKIHFIKE